MTDFRHLYYLTRVDGLGSIRIKKLLDVFKDPGNVFICTSGELTKVDGISAKTAESILTSKNGMKTIEKDYAELEKKILRTGTGVLTYLDPKYPEYLKWIYDPPVILYYRGGPEMFNGVNISNSVAIVGTRKPTDYGKRVSAQFAEELSSVGVNVISGFARGVDTVVHKAVLSNKESKAVTMAVLGCGVDVVYPPENRKLYEKMSEEGIFFSEYEVSAKPDSVNFPRRNRIISGLSLGVIVTESGKNGGALITARYALDQSREIFAVPGYITSKYSGGTNALIKNGQAKLVENTEDVLVELEGKLKNIKISSGSSKKDAIRELTDLNSGEKAILELLTAASNSINIDDISESTGLNISDCLVNLLNLEFKGYVTQLPGKRFKTVQ